MTDSCWSTRERLRRDMVSNISVTSGQPRFLAGQQQGPGVRSSTACATLMISSGGVRRQWLEDRLVAGADRPRSRRRIGIGNRRPITQYRIRPDQRARRTNTTTIAVAMASANAASRIAASRRSVAWLHRLRHLRWCR